MAKDNDTVSFCENSLRQKETVLIFCEGIDGIILNDEEFGGVSFVVFDSNKIKIIK